MRRLSALLRLTSVNAGLPTSREAHGNRVPIVAKCPKEGLGQDEGEQVISRDEMKVRFCVMQ